MSADRLKNGCLFPPLTAVRYAERDLSYAPTAILTCPLMSSRHSGRDASAAIAAAMAENAQKSGRLTTPAQADFFAYAKSLMYKPIPQEI